MFASMARLRTIGCRILLLTTLCLVASGQTRRGNPPRSATAQRIEKRAYTFKETNTKIEYAVFVSTKVKKGNKSPLVIALHGAGVTPDQMISFISDSAQDGGYIVAA